MSKSDVNPNPLSSGPSYKSIIIILWNVWLDNFYHNSLELMLNHQLPSKKGSGYNITESADDLQNQNNQETIFKQYHIMHNYGKS